MHLNNTKGMNEKIAKMRAERREEMVFTLLRDFHHFCRDSIAEGHLQIIGSPEEFVRQALGVYLDTMKAMEDADND